MQCRCLWQGRYDKIATSAAGVKKSARWRSSLLLLCASFTVVPVLLLAEVDVLVIVRHCSAGQSFCLCLLRDAAGNHGVPGRWRGLVIFWT